MTFEQFERAAKSAAAGVLPDAFVACEEIAFEFDVWAVHVYPGGKPVTGTERRFSCAVDRAEAESGHALAHLETTLAASLRRSLRVHETSRAS